MEENICIILKNTNLFHRITDQAFLENHKFIGVLKTTECPSTAEGIKQIVILARRLRWLSWKLLNKLNYEK